MPIKSRSSSQSSRSKPTSGSTGTSKRQRRQSTPRTRRTSVSSSAPTSARSPDPPPSPKLRLNAAPNDTQRPLRYSRPSQPTRLSIVFENVASMWTNRQSQAVSNEVVLLTKEDKKTSGGNGGGSAETWWSWLIVSGPRPKLITCVSRTQRTHPFDGTFCRSPSQL